MTAARKYPGRRLVQFVVYAAGLASSASIIYLASLSLDEAYNSKAQTASADCRPAKSIRLRIRCRIRSHRQRNRQ